MRYIQTIVILHVLASSAFACQCEVIAEPNKAFEHSSAIFVGRICGLRKENDSVNIGSSAYNIQVSVVTFCVEQSWKGVEGNSFDILSDYSSCDYNFEINGRYLVYAESDSLLKGRSYASKCFPIKKAEEAAEDIHILDGLKDGVSPKR